MPDYARGPFGFAGYHPPLNDLGPFDDVFAGTTLDAKWTLRNITAGEAAVSGGKVALALNAQGDMMYQLPAAMPALPCRFIGHFRSMSAGTSMTGIAVLNNVGTGAIFCPYDAAGNSYYVMGVTTYGYSATGPSITGAGLTDFWLEAHFNGTQLKGRCAVHDPTWLRYTDVVWGSYTSAFATAVTHDRFGILRAYTATCNVDLLEFRVLPG